MRGPKRREIGHGASGRAGFGTGHPRGLPLYTAFGQRSGEQQWLHQHGLGLWQHPGVDGCRCAITAPVAGIAMGLIQNPESGAYKVLSDIQGLGRCAW